MNDSPGRRSQSQGVGLRAYCTIDGCLKAAEPRQRMCAMHRKRKQRGKPLDSAAPSGNRYASPADRLLEAAYTLNEVDSEADGDAEFERFQARLKEAAINYAKSTPALSADELQELREENERLKDMVRRAAALLRSLQL